MKKKRIIAVTAVVVLISIAGFFAKKYFFPGDSDRIRRTLGLVCSSVEKKETGRFLKQFTLDYRDDFNNTYGSLFMLAREHFKNYRNISVKLSQIEITIDGKEAEARFFAEVSAVSSESDEVFKDAGRLFAKLKKEDFKWKVCYIGGIEDMFD